MLCLNRLKDPFLPFYLLVFDHLVICAFYVVGNFELWIKFWQDVMMSGLWEDCLFSWKKIEVGIDQLSPTRNRRGSVTSHQSSREFSLCVFSFPPDNRSYRSHLKGYFPSWIFPFTLTDTSGALNEIWAHHPQLLTLFFGGFWCLHLEGARH